MQQLRMLRAASLRVSAIRVVGSCRTCSELVDGNQWRRLTQRALRKFVKRHQVPRHEVPTLSAQFAEIHRSFAEHLLKEPR